MSSCDASRIVQCNLGLFDSFRLLSIKNGLGFPRMVCDVTCFRFDLVMMNLLLQEKIMPFFDEFNSIELNWTRSRYSFSSEKLVIFENDPLSILSHWVLPFFSLNIWPSNITLNEQFPCFFRLSYSISTMRNIEHPQVLRIHTCISFRGGRSRIS